MEHHVPAAWQALHERFDALGRAVAAALNAEPSEEGPGWRHEAAVNAYGSVMLSHPAGWRVQIGHHRTTGHARSRLTITGCTPSGWPGNSNHEITVADTRPPAAIAREIQRRLLPDYRPTMRQALADIEQEQRYAQRRAATMDQLQEALPALHPYDWDPARGSFYATDRECRPLAHASGTVMVRHSGERVDLKLTDVPAELAAWILARLNAAPPVLTGRVMPREVGQARAELPAPSQVVPGEVVSAAAELPAAGTAPAPVPHLLAAEAQRR
ncbi:hypothetical protein [Kitasatospora sp. NPDC093679]|uniref:hypothetical protein n=1 Tax=Kitasatospora sp. NPDC093679 TaxID=3154983 RepID=UPI00341F8D2F